MKSLNPTRDKSKIDETPAEFLDDSIIHKIDEVTLIVAEVTLPVRSAKVVRSTSRPLEMDN